MQIPHHGSTHNSNINNFNYFNSINTYFITTQSVTNGHGQPHVSREYINNPKVILLTEEADPLWCYEQENGIIWTNFV